MYGLFSPRACRALILLLVAFFVLPLTGCKRESAAADSRRPVAGKATPSLRYLFAHKYLPQALHREPRLALALALSKENEKLVMDMWQDCREQSILIGAAPVPPDGLTVAGGPINEETAGALIVMPVPLEMPEAYYAFVFIPMTEGKDGIEAGSISYYTLERSISLTSDSGRTVIGAWTADGTHLNYGTGPAPDDIEAFMRAVVGFYKAERR